MLFKAQNAILVYSKKMTNWGNPRTIYSNWSHMSILTTSEFQESWCFQHFITIIKVTANTFHNVFLVYRLRCTRDIDIHQTCNTTDLSRCKRGTWSNGFSNIIILTISVKTDCIYTIGDSKQILEHGHCISASIVISINWIKWYHKLAKKINWLDN